MKLADKRLAERKLKGGGWKEEAERRLATTTTATTTTTTSSSLAWSQLCAANFELAEIKSNIKVLKNLTSWTKEMTET